MEKVPHSTKKQLRIIFDREEDGRIIAEVPSIPGVLAYGATKQEARKKVYSIALRALADRAEQGRTPAVVSQLFT